MTVPTINPKPSTKTTPFRHRIRSSAVTTATENWTRNSGPIVATSW
jgi:hypothetical protein